MYGDMEISERRWRIVKQSMNIKITLELYFINISGIIPYIFFYDDQHDPDIFPIIYLAFALSPEMWRKQ